MWWVYKTAKFIVPKFPCHAKRFLCFFASVKYFFSLPDQKRVIRNFKLVQGSDFRFWRALFRGRQVLCGFVKYWADFIWFGFDRNALLENVGIENKAFLEEAVEKGKGVILLTAHIGNWEAAGMRLGEEGFDMYAIALPHRDKRINDFFDSTRAMHNLKIIPTGSASKCLRVLNGKRILALVGDWDFSGGKAVMPATFFGRRILMPAGPATFSLRKQCPIVPAFSVRNKDGSYVLKLSAPIYPEGKTKEQIHQVCVSRIEGAVSRYYAQWYMFGPIRNAGEEINPEEVCIIIPAYNEAKVIGGVLEALRPFGYAVVVVNDGSTDNTREVLARYKWVDAISFSCNEGKGVAIKEALGYAKEKGFKWALLMDADGQHSIEDIPAFFRATNSKVGMVCGSRLRNPSGMPIVRLFINRLMSLIISGYVGQWIPDTQCGFRLLRLEAINPQDLTSDKYEVETDIILRVRESDWEIVSVGIKSVYHEHAVSYINPVRDTCRFIKFMLKDLFSKKCPEFIRKVVKKRIF